MILTYPKSAKRLIILTCLKVPALQEATIRIVLKENNYLKKKFCWVKNAKSIIKWIETICKK